MSFDFARGQTYGFLVGLVECIFIGGIVGVVLTTLILGG